MSTVQIISIIVLFLLSGGLFMGGYVYDGIKHKEWTYMLTLVSNPYYTNWAKFFGSFLLVAFIGVWIYIGICWVVSLIVGLF